MEHVIPFVWLAAGPVLVLVGNCVAEACWRRPGRRRRWAEFIEAEKAKGPIFREYTLEELQR